MLPLARLAAPLLLLLSLVAAPPAGALPPETDATFSGFATYPLGGSTVLLDGRALYAADGRLLANELLCAPKGDGSFLCAADEGHDGLGQLRCWDSALREVLLAAGGRPSRLALQAGNVAWVASPTGLPQVFVASTDGKVAPRALTNVGLQRVPGRAPAGFVPPPLRDTLRFDGDRLRWETQDGPREVRWR